MKSSMYRCREAIGRPENAESSPAIFQHWHDIPFEHPNDAGTKLISTSPIFSIGCEGSWSAWSMLTAEKTSHSLGLLQELEAASVDPLLPFTNLWGFCGFFFPLGPELSMRGVPPCGNAWKKNYLKKFWLVLITKQNKSWHLREILCAKWLLPQPKNTSFNSIHAVNCMATLGGSRRTQLSSCFQKMKIQVMVICHNSPWWAVGEISYHKLFLTLKNSYVMVDMCPTCYVIKYTDTPGLNNINSTPNSCPINPLNEFSKVISHFCFSKKSENLYDT